MLLLMKVREMEVENTAEYLHPDPKTTLLWAHSVLPNPRPETHSRQGLRQRGDCSNPPHHLVTAYLRAPNLPTPTPFIPKLPNSYSLNSSFLHPGSTYNTCSVLFCFILEVSQRQWTAVLQKGFGSDSVIQPRAALSHAVFPLCYFMTSYAKMVHDSL